MLTKELLDRKIDFFEGLNTTEYNYDSENQLISATHPEADALHQLETFTYDLLGNRTQDNQGSYTYDDKKFRLEEDWKYLYAYDLNGNLVNKQEKGMSGKVWAYAYTSENQLTKAEYYEGTSKLKIVSFVYDVQGRRIKKTVEDNQTGSSYARKYAYDGSEIIAELDVNDNVLAKYTHSGLRTDDALGVEVTSAGVSAGLASSEGDYLYLKDGLGSVTAVTDTSGNVLQRYVYSSFGELLKTTDNLGNEISPLIRTSYTYTNRELDEETGLYYYRARYYDSFTGRFMQEDPHAGSIATPSSFNSKYSYADNDPANVIDPTGLFSIGKELGNFFGGSGGWTGDLLTAAVVVGIIVASGGTLGPAMVAVAYTAAGAVVAAGITAGLQGGDFMKNFSNNFHTDFRVSATFLALSAAGAGIFGGGIKRVGGTSKGIAFQGFLMPENDWFPMGSGMSAGSASTNLPGWRLHEFGHVYHYYASAAIAGLSARLGGGLDTWEVYATTGAVISPWDHSWWATPQF